MDIRAESTCRMASKIPSKEGPILGIAIAGEMELAIEVVATHANFYLN